MVKLLKACFIPFHFRKGKTANFIVPAQSYNQFLLQFTQYQEQFKFYILVLLTVIGGRVCYHGWTEFCYDWLKLNYVSVLGSQVFGQALMHSCGSIPIIFHENKFLIFSTYFQRGFYGTFICLRTNYMGQRINPKDRFSNVSMAPHGPSALINRADAWSDYHHHPVAV